MDSVWGRKDSPNKKLRKMEFLSVVLEIKNKTLAGKLIEMYETGALLFGCRIDSVTVGNVDEVGEVSMELLDDSYVGIKN